jgi:hypothetical protein
LTVIEQQAVTIKSDEKTNIMGVALGGDAMLTTQMGSIATSQDFILSVPSPTNATSFDTVVKKIQADACARMTKH